MTRCPAGRALPTWPPPPIEALIIIPGAIIIGAAAVGSAGPADRLAAAAVRCKPDPGGSACCDWNGYGRSVNHG